MRNGILALVVGLGISSGLCLAQPPAKEKPESIPAPRELVQPTPPSETPLLTAGFWLDGAGPERFWAEVEYLLWWVKEGPTGPPLLTTGTGASLGILGTPGTTVLFGAGGDLDYGTFSGGRFALGSWLGEDRLVGVEGIGFFLGEETSQFTAASDANGSSLLARPIINAATSAETAVTVAAPGSFVGSFDASSTSQLWGAEFNGLVNLIRQGGSRLDLLAGFRYLDLEEDLDLISRTTPLPGGFAFFEGNPVLGPNSVAIGDSFRTRNRFYGGQLGARGRLQRGRLSLDVTGKVAFGAVRQSVQIAGSSVLLAPDGAVLSRANGGLLALPTNIGRWSDSDGAIVPELGLKLGFQVTERLTLSLGYTLLYFDNVLRPGDQINRVVNLTQVPVSAAFGPLTGPAQPAPFFNDSRFWAQGVSLGMAFRY